MPENICFTIENVVLGMQKRIKNQSKIDAKSMLEKRHTKSMENDASIEPKWMPESIKNAKKKTDKCMPKSMRKNGREKERQGPERNLAVGAQEHTIQQDRVLSIKRKTSKKKNLSKEKPLKGETLKSKTPTHSNTPWAPSGPERI